MSIQHFKKLYNILMKEGLKEALKYDIVETAKRHLQRESAFVPTKETERLLRKNAPTITDLVSSANDVYIIVHEFCVGAYYELDKTGAYREKAIRVLAEIDRIKNDFPDKCFQIREGDYKLHHDMPPSSQDLRVLVLGAFKGGCCMTQLAKLLDSGYNAYIYEKGCYNPPENVRI